MSTLLHAKEISKNVTDRVIKDFPIPPRPEILKLLQNEVQQEEIDLLKVAQLINSDVAVSAAVIKLINSAFFGLESKITSVFHAVNLLGIQPTVNLVTGLILQNSFKKNHLTFPRFWDSATSVAKTCAYISVRLELGNKDEAYLTGLFHDLGIPVMARIYSDFKEVLEQENHANNDLFTDIEDEEYSTNHALIGGIICLEWGFPEEISNAVLNHHNLTIYSQDMISQEAEEYKLLVILKLAELCDYKHREDEFNFELDRIKPYIMSYLQLNETELLAFIEELIDCKHE